MIKRLSMVATFVFLPGFASAADAATEYGDRLRGPERASYRFQFDNDLFFGVDEKVSGAMALQKHTGVAASWEQLQGVPAFLKRWGAAIPTLTADDLSYRMGLSLGLVVQTPGQLSRRDLIEDDVPYAGVLATSASWYAYNDDQFRGFELVLGVVGPASLAEQAQKTGHEIVNKSKPRGWDNQLENEPLVNFNYMRKQKVLREGEPAGMAFDLAINENLCLGTMFTQASVSTEIRFGKNMPRGFVYVPSPIGFSTQHKATLAPANSGQPSLYGSLVLRGTAVARNVFLDGNLYRDSHSVDKEPVLGQLIAGVHYERENWSLYFNAILSTDDVDTNDATEAKGSGMLGSLTIEWRL